MIFSDFIIGTIKLLLKIVSNTDQRKVLIERLKKERMTNGNKYINRDIQAKY